MSSRFRHSLIGVDAMLGEFSRFDVEMRKAVRASVKKSATNIRKAAQARVPVDQGIMKKSIKAKFSSDGLSAEVGPTSSFAHLVEFGTVDTRAQPFMAPTAEEQIPKYVQDMEDAIRGVVR